MANGRRGEGTESRRTTTPSATAGRLLSEQTACWAVATAILGRRIECHSSGCYGAMTPLRGSVCLRTSACSSLSTLEKMDLDSPKVLHDLGVRWIQQSTLKSLTFR